jgi:hypothetical protein
LCLPVVVHPIDVADGKSVRATGLPPPHFQLIPEFGFGKALTVSLEGPIQSRPGIISGEDEPSRPSWPQRASHSPVASLASALHTGKMEVAGWLGLPGNRACSFRRHSCHTVWAENLPLTKRLCTLASIIKLGVREPKSSWFWSFLPSCSHWYFQQSIWLGNRHAGRPAKTI